MRDRGPAGGESGGVERHARGLLGWAPACTEDQMRSVVSITVNAISVLGLHFGGGRCERI